MSFTVTTSPTPPWPESGTLAGLDLSCVEDIEADGEEVTGRLGIAQAIARRLITPTGTLLGDDPDSRAYGYDLRQWIKSDLSARDRAEIASAVEAQCMAEETVFSADVTVDFLNETLSVTINLADRVGPFRLVLAVSAVTVDLLTIGA